MPNFLESLYYGELIPNEANVPRDAKYRELSRQVSESMDVWKGKLSGDEFRELEELLGLYQQLQSMELAASFSQGFRLGARMVVEVYVE